MCEAVLASLPPFADGARDIRDLFIARGCPVREAQRSAAEL